MHGASAEEKPEEDDLYQVGTYGKLMSQRQETRKAGGDEDTGTRVGIEGKSRFGVKGYSQK